MEQYALRSTAISKQPRDVTGWKQNNAKCMLFISDIELIG